MEWSKTDVTRKLIRELNYFPDPIINIKKIINGVSFYFGMSPEELKKFLCKSLTEDDIKETLDKLQHSGANRLDAEKCLSGELGITLEDLRKIGLSNFPHHHLLCNHPLYTVAPSVGEMIEKKSGLNSNTTTPVNKGILFKSKKAQEITKKNKAEEAKTTTEEKIKVALEKLDKSGLGPIGTFIKVIGFIA